MRITKRPYKSKRKKIKTKRKRIKAKVKRTRAKVKRSSRTRKRGKHGGTRAGSGRTRIDKKLSNYARVLNVFDESGIEAALYLQALVSNRRAKSIYRLRAAEIICKKIVPDLKQTDMRIQTRESAEENDAEIQKLCKEVLKDETDNA